MFNQKFVDNAYKAIKNGGLSLVKADIGYGLLGHSEESIRRMYAIKGRPYSNPCIIAGDIEILTEIAVFSNLYFLEWIKEIAMTTTLAVVSKINPKSSLLNKLSPWVLQQATSDQTIAIFLNSGEYISKMVKKALADEVILVGSSGNLSSKGNHYRFQDVEPEIISKVDYYYDAGICLYDNAQKFATTIIDFANMKIKRKGVNYEKILQSYHTFAIQHQLPFLARLI